MDTQAGGLKTQRDRLGVLSDELLENFHQKLAQNWDCPT